MRRQSGDRATDDRVRLRVPVRSLPAARAHTTNSTGVHTRGTVQLDGYLACCHEVEAA